VKTRSLVVLFGALLSGAAQAQQPAPAGGSMAAVKPLYEMTKNWIIKSAEQMSEANYSFKPTPEVRSFGQLIGHLANSQYEFCVPAKGGPAPNTGDIEKTTTDKAGLVKALKDAFAYCDALYDMPDAKVMEQVDFFGNKGSKLWVLMFNVSHSSEHYGNIVTYMRLKGMVPPSSQRGM
jgi:uncharacterized damage-inducible protein DinB